MAPGWHPLLVHFPLALAISAAAFMGVSRVVGDRHSAVLATAGTLNLWLGALAALVALGSGLAAVLNLHVSTAAHQAVSLHFKWAVLSTLGLLLLAAWRAAGGPPEARPSWLFVLVLCAAGAALVVTGYRGGQNVYRYGIGVMTSDPSSRPGT